MAWRVFPKKQRGYLQIPQLRQFWFGGKPKPSFEAPLTTSLNVSRSKGSGTPTFTRATTAYVEDFEGLLKPVLSGEARFKARRVYNVLTATEALAGGAPWVITKSAAATMTLTAGQTDSLGGTAAIRLQATTDATPDNTHYSILRATLTSAVNTADSIWLKSNTGANQVMGFDWNTQALVTVTPQWQRFALPVYASASTTFDFGLTRAAGQPSTLDVLVAFPQREIVTGQSNQNPSEYVSVGVLSAPYHGANVDGVKYFDYENGNTVASNVVTEAKGAAISSATLLGYLAEGARTNICLWSEDFTNAVWVSGGGGVAVGTNSLAAPDGTTTADTLTASGANGTLIQDLGVIASAAQCFSIYLKRKTGTGNIDLTLDGGSTWTTVAVTASWVRFEKTQTLANPDVGIRIVTSGDEVYAWGAQCE